MMHTYTFCWDLLHSTCIWNGGIKDWDGNGKVFISVQWCWWYNMSDICTFTTLWVVQMYRYVRFVGSAMLACSSANTTQTALSLCLSGLKTALLSPPIHLLHTASSADTFTL